MEEFVKARKQEAKLKMAIEGPSGSGKTMTALKIGRELCVNPERLALVDTENKSASKYADEFPFMAVSIAGNYHPDKYIAKIKLAQAAGFECLIIDSLSHAWFGPGGILELTDDAGKSEAGGNKFGGWKKTTPIQTRLSQEIVMADIHLIATMRTRSEWVIEENDRGKKVPRKVGTEVVQRDDLDYEFDVVGRTDDEHNLVITKTRCSALDGRVFNKAGKDVAEILLNWLKGEKAALPPADEEVVRAYARTKYGFKSRAQFDVWLSEQKLTEESAMERFRGEMAA